MTREETLAIMSVLKAAYPNYYRDMNRKDAEAVVDLWATMFTDEPAELVAMSVKAFIATDTKGFPPHIGAIKEAIGKLLQPDLLTEQEAWALVSKACRNAAYNADSEFRKLPEDLKRIVGSPNQLRAWALMDEDTVQSVVASNFQRSYKAIAAKQKEQAALPWGLQQKMQTLAEGMSVPLLNE